MASKNQETIATAYVQILPSTRGIESELSDAIVPAASSTGSASGAALGAGIMASVGKKIVPAAIFTGIVAASKTAAQTLLNVGKEFDAMTDTIIVGTGATGETLDALVESATNIGKTIPVGFITAGDYVQNLNTRMGLTGQQLEDVGNRTAALSKLFGSGINLDNLTGAFNAFGISNDDAASKMDYLFGVSQATGISFDSLTGIIEKNAPALTNLGFSFEEAANMAGLLDRAGMDANGTMGKLSKALVEVSAPGESAADAYRRVVSEMENYIRAGDTASAIDVASKIFGTRGAAQFVGAVQSGAVSMDELSNAALGAGVSILDTYAKTEDYPDQLDRIENKAKAAFEPMGGALMEAAAKALERIGVMLDNIDEEKLAQIGQDLGEALVNGINALASAIEFLISHYDEIKGFFEGVNGFLEFTRTGPLALFGQAITNSAENAGIDTQAVSDSFGTMVGNIGGSIGNAIGSIAQLPQSLSGDAASVQNSNGAIAGAFSSMAGNVGNAIRDANGSISSMPGAASSAASGTVNPFYGLGNAISNAIGNIHFPTPHVWWENVSVFGMELPIQLPHVEWYKRGGLVSDATLIGAGESGTELIWPSYEPYLSRYADAIASRMDGNGGGVDIHDCVFNVREDGDIRKIAYEINEITKRQMAGGIA